MKYLTLTLLNLFDAAATGTGIWLGLLGEDNPLLAWMPLAGIMLVKMIPTNYFILVLYNTRTYALSRIGTWMCIGVYVHIFTLHAIWIGAVL
jgi:hypothetical protein